MFMLTQSYPQSGFVLSFFICLNVNSAGGKCHVHTQTPPAESSEPPKPIWVNSSADNSVPGALISEDGLWGP